MKKGIRGHDVEAKGLENIWDTAKKAGMEYLQLVLEKSLDDFKTGDFTEEYAEKIKVQLGDAKVAILGSYINPSNPDDEKLREEIEKFKEKIRYAKILKPIAVGTETGKYKEGETYSEEAYQRLLETMREIVKYAEKYDVNIGIEGVCWFVINDPKKMKRIIDDLASPNVKVIFDPVNYLNFDNYRNQDEMIRDAFDLFADRICAIHAKDFTVEDGRLKGAKITEGMLNYNLIFEKMREYNLDIPIICEGINEKDAIVAFEKLENIKDMMFDIN
ncbi:MAG: sugar phosphate isomerase/epimerase [Clostridia bacterium]|nr:sugar phosphate isomerase/epimerase [Clostridia bacterium]